jgi:predicted metal-dependent enzyme (double-stranded beta helix superfamily)
MSSPAVLFEHARPLPVDPTVPPAPTGPAALAAALAAASDRWLGRVRYRPLSRWTQLLETADAAALLHPDLHRDLVGVQIWVLSWLPGQGTPLHDHGRSAGAFAVVRGELTERIVSTGPAGLHETTARLGVDRMRQFGAHYVHQVTNEDGEPAVSVHVYTPALREMNTYDVDGGRLLRTGTEKAGVDW